MEPPYDALMSRGVISTRVGFSGGTVENPSYARVTKGDTGHREVVEVVFDPARIRYAELVEVFWSNIDPYDDKGQFCDKGDPYRAGVFFMNDGQKREFERVRDDLIKQGRLRRDHSVFAVPGKAFFPAEEEHQDYYRKNPIRYKFYRERCGRDRRLREVWTR
jgi:peptide-methionine (S)-S-oxide reductase